VSAEYWNFSTDVMHEWARQRTDRPALYIVEPDGRRRQITFGVLGSVINQTVHYFRDHGIRPGDRVLVMLGKNPAFWPVMVALLQMGAVPMPATTQLTDRDIHFRLSRAESHAAILLPEIASRLSPDVKSLLSIRIAVGSVPDFDLYDPWHLTTPPHMWSHPTRIDDPALLYFTSGTTGHPKMVLHTHEYPRAHHITASYWLGLTADDLHWNLSDTGWAKAAWSSLFGPWMVGATVLVDPLVGRFRPEDLVAILSREPVTSLCAPPTAYRMLVQLDLKPGQFPALRSLAAAGEPLNPEIIAAMERMTGLTVRDGYGQTETVLLIGNPPGAPVKPGSMGRPAPPFTMAVLDDDGQPVVGREGDIALLVSPERPPGLFETYLGDPDEVAKRRRGPWYLTGDRAIQDDEGYFWFVGRADDVIISAGYRIGPFEVESALIEHPAVVEAAAVASPDPVRGAVVKAFVVLRPDVTPSDALIAELQEHVKKTTAPYKYPRRIEFVHELPKTVSGKIRRVELREREWGASPS